ncbi:MAG: GAF domain-containing sensor histidine kinase [Candidatus Omnitrophica bacterium]|nr:GAF domain-containing sensor histidine kinase [Candidatus Omnitrophota bacterium]
MATSDIINILFPLFILTVILLGMLVIVKIRRVKQLQSQTEELKKSLDDMDEQAKLIVRTDMELNKIQDELDKKITGLYALQRISRATSTALEENQIFKRINPEHLEDLGFERASGFLWHNEEKKFILQLNVGYSEEEINRIKIFIGANEERCLKLIASEKTFSSLSQSDNLIAKEEMRNIFSVTSFIISPIISQQGNKGLLFVGTQNTETLITEGDEELIKILATQLGQTLDNAHLFEKTWRAQQELEDRVKERTRELTLALEEVKKISRRKTDFVSSVSHELRTPLTSVKGYTAILLAGKLGKLPQEAQERLEKINRHTDELVHIVNDLLDISRIESGRVIMKLEPIDLRNTVAKVGDLLSGQLKEKNIYLDVIMKPSACSVLADNSQIERVFINLFGNALKFTPAEGKISIQNHKIDKMVQVDVSDTGCGIPKEAQEAIFEEFFRVDNAINQGVKGTGLGLALVKNIIEAHGGKIWVKSKAGSGATFSFTLFAAP